jgi:hypothetical protein
VGIFPRNELGGHRRRILHGSQLGAILHCMSRALISVLYGSGCVANLWLLFKYFFVLDSHLIVINRN